MPKLCGTDSFYGGGMVTGQPIGTMIGSRMINNAQAGFIIGAVIDQALNVDVLPNKEEAGKGLGILNLATTLGQAVGPTITSVVKTTTGTYTPAFAISIVMAVCAAVFVLRIQKVK